MVKWNMGLSLPQSLSTNHLNFRAKGGDFFLGIEIALKLQMVINAVAGRKLDEEKRKKKNICQNGVTEWKPVTYLIFISTG